jgi:hypothetical protein
VRRPATTSVAPDELAEEISTGASIELELISTQMLKQILASNDDGSRSAIEEAAGGSVEGVLARDTATGYFEIIDNDELQAILDQQENLPKISCPSDATLEPLHDYVESESLSLVSTQALRRVFEGDKADEPDALSDLKARGYNPYNTG